MWVALGKFALRLTYELPIRGGTMDSSNFRIEVAVSGPVDMTDEEAEEAALDAAEAEVLKSIGF
jgi:hypothetical protein